MPTLNYYNDTTGMMTKVRYTDAASATSDVQYYFNKARRMTKLTDWTGDLEYRYPPSADHRLHIRQLTKIIDYDTEDQHYAYPPMADLRHAVGRVSPRCPSGTRPVGLDLRCVLDLGCRRGLRHSDFT